MIALRIKDVARINRSVLPEDTRSDFRFKYIDIGAVDELGNINIPTEFSAFGTSASRARRLAPAGAVVVSTVRTYLRAIATVPETEEPLVFSTGFTVLEAQPQVSSRFLGYYCRSQPFIDEVVARSVGINYPAISAGEIGNLRIPLPSEAEQRHIADFLDAETARIDVMTDAEQRVLRLLTERRAAGVTHAISGNVQHEHRRSTELPWLDSLLESWPEVRLGLLARMGSGHTPSRSRPDWWIDCDIPWVTTGEVKHFRGDRTEDLFETREKISKLGLENSAAELRPAGTVFLSRTAASAGYSGVMGLDMATSQDFVTWTCGPRLDPYYLLWCLRAMRPDLLGRLAMGSTHKTIYVPDLQMLRIPLPPLETQSQIVSTIRRQNARIDNLTDKIRRQIGLLAERRQALITAAVTGQFDVSTASGRNVTAGIGV